MQVFMTHTISEPASAIESHPNQFSERKRQLLADGARLFQRNVLGQQPEHEALQTELYEQIGRLKMEWLKRQVARST